MKPLTTILFTGLFIAGCGGGGGGGGDDGNAAPVISGEAAAIARAGEPFFYAPRVADRDGDLLTLSVENLPEWAHFDAGTGVITGFPDQSHYGAYDDIVIRVSDGRLRASLNLAVDVLPPLLKRDAFTSLGTTIETADGFQSQGTLVMAVDGSERQFEDADLQLKFDAEGNLIELAGETIIPPKVSEHLSLDAQVKTTVGYFSGKDLNADPDIDILLNDDQYYFVYYYGQDLDMTLKDRDGSGGESSLTLSTPLGGEILFVTDPTDVFYYYYGNIPFVGAAGQGESDNGLIPFEPALEYAQLDRFDGHSIEKASMGLGVKIFDFFEITGTRVIRQPDFAQIYLDDPFFEDVANSLDKVEYKMGINGDADFAFAIAGFGLFDFDLTDASLTLDVGFDRQHMAMRTQTPEDVSWVPKGFLVIPAAQTIGDWFVDGNGDYEIVLSTIYQSEIPAATLNGSLGIANGNLSLSAVVEHDEKPLGIEAILFPGGIDAVVDVQFDFDPGIRQSVLTAMDAKIDEWHRAFEDLQQKTADFEFELSLRGLRSAIPGIVDNLLPVVNGIPATVKSQARDAAGSWYDKNCDFPCNQAISKSGLKNTVGNQAHSQAADAIKPIVNALNHLKSTVNASDEQFRDAIKAALKRALDNRTFSKKIVVKYDFGWPVGTKTVYSKTHTKAVLTGKNLIKIETAYANVDRIPATSNLMIQAQQVYDALPVEETINTAKQEVENGLAQVPTSLDGVGYTVDNGVYSAWAVLDGKTYEVPFNVLQPDELAAGIGRLIADNLVGS